MSNCKDKEINKENWKIKIESMAIDIREKPAMGNSKLVCSNCHHRGHRDQNSKPCILQKCTDYTFCGVREKHPEYFSRLNSLKSDLKKKNNTVKELEEQIRSMNDFSSNSEYHFIKNLIPRLHVVDKGYKINKPKLMCDIRMLRKWLNGKIPPVTSNDPEQLRILLRKCRMHFNLELDSPDDANSQSKIRVESTTMACSSPVKNTFDHYDEDKCMATNSVSVNCNDDNDAPVEGKCKKDKKNKKRRKNTKDDSVGIRPVQVLTVYQIVMCLTMIPKELRVNALSCLRITLIAFIVSRRMDLRQAS